MQGYVFRLKKTSFPCCANRKLSFHPSRMIHEKSDLSNDSPLWGIEARRYGPTYRPRKIYNGVVYLVIRNYQAATWACWFGLHRKHMLKCNHFQSAFFPIQLGVCKSLEKITDTRCCVGSNDSARKHTGKKIRPHVQAETDLQCRSLPGDRKLSKCLLNKLIWTYQNIFFNRL